jgi:hypothetical protein
LSEKRDSLLRLLKNKSFKEERMTKVGVDAIDKSTPLESNKSLLRKRCWYFYFVPFMLLAACLSLP